MRHRRKGRHLGRSSPHRKAMFRNLASSLFLSEREDDVDESGFEYPDWSGHVPNRPKVKGRVITTLQKAKAVRPLVEKCITIARRGLQHEAEAAQHGTDAERGSDAWRKWRESDKYAKWQAAMGPAVTLRRRCLQLLGNKQAVRILFESVAPRFTERPGGYTRILRLADPRLGDAGTRAILELVGVRDRVSQRAAAAPAPAIEAGDE